MKTFFILISFFFLSEILAMDCSPVNLITEVDSPFAKIPVYDQKDSNICYAFAAAQMLDYHLIKNGAEKRTIHPVWLALNYALGRNREGLNIGHTKDSIERLGEVSNCEYDRVSSALAAWAGTGEMHESRIIASIEKDALKKYSMNPVQMVSKLLLPGCEQRTQVKVPKVEKYNYSQLPDDQSFEKFLIERIGKSHSPYSIAYCSRIWKDASYDGIELTYFGKRDSLKKDCNYHESIVVGRKPVGNTCQLLVRNTWGTQWKSGNKNWKCLCREKASGAWVDDCESGTHSDDQFTVEACWIPAEKLARNVGVVTFMETP